MLPPTTRLGHVHLTVADLEKQLRFYQSVLGFRLHWRDGARAGLGAGADDLLRLTEAPAARRVLHTTGLYHFAVLYPGRKELARAVARLFSLRYPNHPTDHVISETTYLDDPEGQNIELYIRTLHRGTMDVINGDFTVRRFDGQPASGRDLLDLDDLFRELTPGEALDLPLPAGTRLGHIHLYAASLADSMRFYHDILGFQKGLLTSSFRMGDVGLSEDQPHVVAFNTWKGDGAPPAPPEALGMRYFNVVLPDSAALDQVLARVEQDGLATKDTDEGVLVRDPSQIAVILTTSPEDA
jgi:catechol 2,3-dioxygenase